jgi:ElaA protein
MNENLEVVWVVKVFDDLTNTELYKILQLRNAVFIVEQQCCYQDMDNKDLFAHHLMGWLGDELVSYTRLFDKEIMYEQASIGRVIVSASARKDGLGRKLMELSIQQVTRLYGEQAVKIGAQFYLKRFYESLGFQQVSDIYLEDDIPHIYMVKGA